MISKSNTHHVEDFAFHEIGTFPKIRQGINDTIRFRHPRLQSNAMSLPNRVELPHDFEPLFVVGPIHRAHMDDIIEIHPGIVAQKLGNFMEFVPRDSHRHIASPLSQAGDSNRKRLLNSLEQRMHNDASDLQTGLDLLRLSHKHTFLHNALLQFEDAVQECLRSWRAAGHIDVNGNKSVDSLHDTITVIDVP